MEYTDIESLPGFKAFRRRVKASKGCLEIVGGDSLYVHATKKLSKTNDYTAVGGIDICWKNRPRNDISLDLFSDNDFPSECKFKHRKRAYRLQRLLVDYFIGLEKELSNEVNV